MSLTVHKELPAGVVEHVPLFGGLREARGTAADGVYHMFHYCARCGGWIEGNANTYHENTHMPHMLAGRKGETYYCKRCGREIAFVGIMS